MCNRKVIILGAGVAGISAGYFLKEAGVEAVIYELEDTYGGLCNSFTIDGFTFDTFGHISFDPNTRKWLEDQTEHFVHESEALNFDNGRWLRHPVQNNLYGLPVEERIEIIKDFISKKQTDNPQNYGEWLKSIYGECFAKRYPYKYTKKYWTVEPEELETQWVKGRMYNPDITEVLRGAMTSEVPGVHYSKKANYPQKGGFKAFLKPMVNECMIEYGRRVCYIDTERKQIGFQAGKPISYDYIISTIPLPELCSSIDKIPNDILKASKCLHYTQGVMVSLGFNKPKISPALWFYVYDEDIFPSRIYSPDWKSSDNVPKGCSALQAEIYFSSFKPLEESLEDIKKKAIQQMLRLGLFKESDIIVQDVRMKQYANVIFTPEIYEAREKIHQYLQSKGIHYAGRFGEWDYLWVGQSLLSGRRAAEKCIQEMEKQNDCKSKNKNII